MDIQNIALGECLYFQKKKNEQICPFGIRCWVRNLVIDDEIFNYEMEKHKLQMQIQNVQMKQSGALEQQIQMYMFDWIITMNDRPLPEERRVSYYKGDFYVQSLLHKKIWKGITKQDPRVILKEMIDPLSV